MDSVKMLWLMDGWIDWILDGWMNWLMDGWMNE